MKSAAVFLVEMGAVECIEVPVEASMRGLAITVLPGGAPRRSITHLTSGMAIVQGLADRSEALRALRRLARAGDWRRDYPEVAADGRLERAARRERKRYE
jgi:hypothetical protein